MVWGQINENTVQLDLKHDLKPKYPKHGSVRFSKMISVQSNENTVKLNLKIKVMRWEYSSVIFFLKKCWLELNRDFSDEKNGDKYFEYHVLH